MTVWSLYMVDSKTETSRFMSSSSTNYETVIKKAPLWIAQNDPGGFLFSFLYIQPLLCRRFFCIPGERMPTAASIGRWGLVGVGGGGGLSDTTQPRLLEIQFILLSSLPLPPAPPHTHIPTPACTVSLQIKPALSHNGRIAWGGFNIVERSLQLPHLILM